MIYIILVTYLAITFWGSLIGAKPKDDTPESYFLANRNLNTVSLFFTILATNFSAFYFLGFAGQGYRIGYGIYVIMALGTAFAGLTFLIIGPRIWKLGIRHRYITPAELIYGQTRSRPLSWLFSGVMIIFTLPYLALQIVGGGYILEGLTQGTIGYGLAVTLLTLVTIAYVVIGGMASVAKTDLKQGLIVIVFMSLAVVLVGQDLGGISEANKQAYEILPSLFSAEGVGNFHHPRKWFSYLVFWAFCVPMFPQLFMRFYIAKDLPTLKKSAILYALIPVFISILPVMIGVWGHISFPGLEGKEMDQILPKMLVMHTSEIFSAIVMTGAIAAFMSTLDSQLLALSTMVTRDFYIPIRGKSLSMKDEVFTGRIVVVMLAIIGLLIAWNPFDTIFDMGKMAFAGLAILFPITLAVTKFGRLQPGIAIVAILVCLALLLGFHYGYIPQKWAFGFEPFLIVILVSCMITGVAIVYPMASMSDN